MAPVASTLTLIALASTAAVLEVQAKPLLTPGRHAAPAIANGLAGARRSFHSILARYYGTSHGLSKPPALPEKRDTSVPAGWTYFGCVSESSDERLLQGFAFSSSTLSPLLCLTECQELGYTWGGMEYGDECYCSNDWSGSGGGLQDDSQCSMACQGDASADCGNAWSLSMYQYNSTDACGTSTVTPTTSIASQVVTATAVTGGTTSVGVVTLGTSTVTGTATASDSVTTTASASTSTATSTSTGQSTYTDETDSSVWNSLGCAKDLSSRLLSGSVLTGQKTLTIDSCLTLCEDSGYTYAGLEYGDECYCGDSLPDSITYSTTGCTMACAGDASQTCGGDWTIDLYELASTGNSTSTLSATATSTATSIGGDLAASPSTTTKTSVTATVATTATTAVTTAAATTTAKASSTTAQTAQSTATADATTAPGSSATHYVWAHHMVGNTYSYSESNWADDISNAQAVGIDGFALNMGSDSWESARVSDAFSAAGSSGFKLFLSLDMTSLSCSSTSDAANLVSIVKTFATQSAQATYDGKVLVSTFAGSDCTFGGETWQTGFVDPLTSAGVNIYFVPSLFSSPSTFASNSWMEGELNWNSGWPTGSSDLTTSSDETYMSALGSKLYMPAISPFFYTHFGADTYNKNWLYRGDDWLYCTRWEQVIAMRDDVEMTEILTWNDFGESSYIGTIQGDLPTTSDTWVDGFTHTALGSLTKYYSTAFKTGEYPDIETDELIMWARPHKHDATASSDSVGRPTGYDWTEDYLWAVVLTTESAVVSLTSGSTTQTFAVSAGLTKLKLAMSEGSISGSIIRDGSTVASYNSGSAFTYTNSPTTYNYNYFVGSSSS